MKKLNKFLAMVLVLTLCLSMAACSGDSSDSDSSGEDSSAGTSSESSGGSGDSDHTVLNIGNYSNAVFIGNLDPTGAVAPGFSQGAGYLLYDHLLIITNDGYTSRILSDWEWEDDTTFSGTIKDEVAFNNGDSMTGDDVLYSLQVILDESWMAMWYNFVDLENSTADGKDFTIKTHFPYALADYYLAFFGIVNQSEFEAKLEAADGVYSNLDAYSVEFIEGISSGPYDLVSMTIDSDAQYLLREDWWGYDEYGATMFDELNCRVYGDQTTMAVDMETGVIDLALDVSMPDAQRALDGDMGESVALSTVDQNATYYIRMSEISDKVSDMNVRNAIAHAIDAESISNAAVGTLFGRPSTSLIPDTCDAGYVEPEVIEEYYYYDVDLAKEYLAAAGYEEGELTLTLLCDTTSNGTKVGELVQASLMDIGINCEMLAVDPFSLDQYLDGAYDVDIQVTYGTDNSSAASGFQVISTHVDARNAENYYNDLPGYLDMFDRCQQTTDVDERGEYLREYVLWGAENLKWVSLYDYYEAFLYNPNIIDLDNSAVTSVIQIDITQIASY